MTILDDGYRKSRKRHYCDGWRYLEDWTSDIKDLKRCTGIEKGVEYYFQTNVNPHDGIWTFKCCKQCREEGKRNNIQMYDDGY